MRWKQKTDGTTESRPISEVKVGNPFPELRQQPAKIIISDDGLGRERERETEDVVRKEVSGRKEEGKREEATVITFSPLPFFPPLSVAGWRAGRKDGREKKYFNIFFCCCFCSGIKSQITVFSRKKFRDVTSTILRGNPNKSHFLSRACSFFPPTFRVLRGVSSLHSLTKTFLPALK